MEGGGPLVAGFDGARPSIVSFWKGGRQHALGAETSEGVFRPAGVNHREQHSIFGRRLESP